MGKTNILNAIAWCLYGDEPHLGDESRSLPRVNLDAKNEHILLGENICIVSVKIYVQDNDTLIIYERQLPYNVKTNFELAEKFTVTVTNEGGDSVIFEGEEAKGYVNLYMPEKIREYFYFDGEQLHNYFITDQSTKIKDSIHVVSQVELLTTISDRLDAIVLDKEREAGKTNPDIDNIINEKLTLTGQIENIGLNITEIYKQINNSDRIIKTNSEYLRGQEDVSQLEEKNAKLKIILEGLLESKKQITKDLNIFLRKYKILLTLYPSAKKALEIINDKEKKGLLPPDIDKGLLENMLRVHKCLVCENELGLEEETKIKDLIKRLNVSSITSHLLLSIKSDLERVLEEALDYPNIKNVVFERSRKNDEEIKDIKGELDQIDIKLRNCSDKEKVVTMHEERERHIKILDINLKKVGAEEANLLALNRKLEEVDKKLNTAFNKKKEFQEIREMIKLMKNSKEVIINVKDEMMNEVREKMSKSTMDYFNKFIWKKNTYKEIRLDKDYRLDLIHVEGYSCVGSCSAAERSLLALSFTLALHEVSGFNSILFIDTPVARVSDINRENFARVLSSVSEYKQIIMTFAPSEYSDEIKDVFEPVASNSFKLYTEDERFTQLAKGVEF